MEPFQRLNTPRVHRYPEEHFPLPDLSAFEPYIGQAFYILPFDIWRLVFEYITELRHLTRFLRTCCRARLILQKSVTVIRHLGMRSPATATMDLITTFANLQKLKIWSKRTGDDIGKTSIIDNLVTIVKMPHMRHLSIQGSGIHFSEAASFTIATTWCFAGKAKTGIIKIPRVYIKYGHIAHSDNRLWFTPYFKPETLMVFYPAMSDDLSEDYRKEAVKRITESQTTALFWSGDMRILFGTFSGLTTPLRYLSICHDLNRRQRQDLVHHLTLNHTKLPLEVLDTAIPEASLDKLLTLFPTLQVIGVLKSITIEMIQQLKVKYPHVKYFILYDESFAKGLRRVDIPEDIRKSILYRHYNESKMYRLYREQSEFFGCHYTFRQ